ncbi:MAG: competence/damage-inducible protein A [Clostridia bacterium]|nr:competence/damage-inducible protein A [Clostridia bacterium]
MIAEIVSVGTELLLGQIVNSDAQYLARRLSEAGVTLHHQTTVGDNPDRLREAIEVALSRADIVITTGGIGPTADDITKELSAEALGLPMTMNEEAARQLRAWFERSNHPMTENNLRQAMFAEGAVILRNDFGTAPGCIAPAGGKAVINLPGPPRELYPMFDAGVMPYLEARSGARIVSRYLRVYGMGESMVESKLSDLIAAAQNPTLATYCTLGEVQLRLTVRCLDGEDPGPPLDTLETDIRARLPDVIYAVTEDPHYTMEQAAVTALIHSGKTVALAESCTGGLIAARLVNVPGASGALLEGCIPYSNEAKSRVLGVPEAVLTTHGAVSEQTARAMAEGLYARSRADICLSVTGIAGPDGGTVEKPVGLVWFGLCVRGVVSAEKRTYTGERNRIRTLATLYGMDLVRRSACGE